MLGSFRSNLGKIDDGKKRHKIQEEIEIIVTDM